MKQMAFALLFLACLPMLGLYAPSSDPPAASQESADVAVKPESPKSAERDAAKSDPDRDVSTDRFKSSNTSGSERLIYSNTGGTTVIAPGAGVRIADDVTTLAGYGCALQQFAFEVDGDPDDDDAIDYGAFTVHFALYETCPSSYDCQPNGPSCPRPIYGTSGAATFADEGRHEVQVLIPSMVCAGGEHDGEACTTDDDCSAVCTGGDNEGAPCRSASECPNGTCDLSRLGLCWDEISLPSSFFLGVSFDRDHAGILGGSPANVGISADKYDDPSAPCDADLGGFPLNPHASFNVEIFADSSCSPAFPAYRNSNHVGEPFSPGSQRYFADDITLDVNPEDCNMVALEVALRGAQSNSQGAVRVDLYSRLSGPGEDPLSTGIIPGTRAERQVFGRDIVLLRRTFATPIPLSDFLGTGPAHRRLFAVYRTTSVAIGPVKACDPPLIGSSSDSYFEYVGFAPDGSWQPVDFGDDCYSGFDVTIYCEGSPATGACCDMVATDSDGEAVCGDVPKMNCQSAELWVEGATCGSTCVGGSNDGQPCTRYVDCPGGTCPGPFEQSCGLSACCLPDGSCADLTANECEAAGLPNDSAIFQPGQTCNSGQQLCPRRDCLGRTGDCDSAHPAICVGGSEDGLACDPSEDCATATCCQGGGACDSAPGCDDVGCCTMVCDVYSHSECCEEHWDATCAASVAQICSSEQKFDECFDVSLRSEAMELQSGAGVTVDLTHATDRVGDPGFCCFPGNVGAHGLASLWFTFTAPPIRLDFYGDEIPSSVRLSVVAEDPPPTSTDVLLQVFAPSDREHGRCRDQTACSPELQDCTDGSFCEIDLATVCESLETTGCTSENDLCISDLTPGQAYVVMLAAVSNDALGTYTLTMRDDCDLYPSDLYADCDGNRTPDVCDFAPFGGDIDCDSNGIPDHCDEDCNGDDIPDACQMPPLNPTGDCDGDQILDVCEVDDVIETYRLVELEPFPPTAFAKAVAVDDGVAAVSAQFRWLDDLNVSPVDMVDLFRLVGDRWVYEDSLFPIELGSNAGFGEAIAISGDVIAVGFVRGFVGTTFAGGIYIYRRREGRWRIEAKLTDAEGEFAYGLGTKLDVHGDLLVFIAGYLDRVFIYRFDGTTWNQEGILDPYDYQQTAQEAVVHNDRIAVLTWESEVMVFERNGAEWTLTDELEIEDVSSPPFERSALAIDDERIVAGTAGGDAGSYPYCQGQLDRVFVFRNTGAGWIEEGELPPPGSNQLRSRLCFGLSVAIDGETIVAGAPGYTELVGNREVRRGAVYVYRRLSDRWSQVASVLGRDLGFSGQSAITKFGSTLGLSANHAVVGAPANPNYYTTEADFYDVAANDCNANRTYDACEVDSDEDGVIDACDNCVADSNPSQVDCDGNAVGDLCQMAQCASDDPFCQDCNGNGTMDGCEVSDEVVQVGTIPDPLPDETNGFGGSFSLSGNRMIVGAWGEGPGTAYIFKAEGDQWIQEARLVNPDTTFVGVDFGRWVALDANRTVVLESANFGRPWPIFIYERVLGQWELQPFVFMTVEPDSIWNGGRVLDLDGDLAVVGDFYRPDPGFRAGAVHGVHFNGEEWQTLPIIKPADPASQQEFGYAVALDGRIMVVGAPGESGGAYLFRFTGSQWVQIDKIVPQTPITDERFGASVALHHGVLVVGAPGTTVSSFLAGGGRIYVFRYDGTGWQEIGIVESPLGSGQRFHFGSFVDIHGDTIMAATAHSEVDVMDQTFVIQLSPDRSHVENVFAAAPKQPYFGPVQIEERLAVFSAAGELSLFDVDRRCNAADFIPDDCEPDADGDKAVDACDNCPDVSNMAQSDRDEDSVGDACDNCPATFNADQADADSDGVGDLCDNCPAHANADQADCDGDGDGDICEIATCVDDLSCGDCNANDIPDGCDLKTLGDETMLVASDGDAGDAFGSAMDLSGDRLIVGAHLDEENGINAGAAYVFERQAGVWVETDKLTPGDNAADDRFGSSVGIDGNWATVGAPFDDDIGENSGSVVVFTIIDGKWMKQGQLMAPDGVAGDQFGASLALRSRWLAVGAPGDDDHGLNTGSVSVFYRNGPQWRFEAKLTAPDAAAGDSFGERVALSNGVLVVGAGSNDSACADCGAAYVFRFDGHQWAFEQQLTGGDSMAGDQFGASVAISGDVIVVGAGRTDTAGVDSGTAYVYQYDSTIGMWSDRGQLRPDVGSTAAGFGSAIAVYGHVAAIGAPFDSRFESKSGATYVYEYRGGSWIRTGVYRRASGAALDFAGAAVVVSPDQVIIGAHGDDQLGLDAGAVFEVSLPPYDCHGDGIPDACQFGDIDGSSDVSLRDFSTIANCMNGACGQGACDPPLPINQCCSVADQDRDGDVDLIDLARWQRSLHGPPQESMRLSDR